MAEAQKYQVGQRITAFFDFLPNEDRGARLTTPLSGAEMKRGKRYPAQIVGMEEEGQQDAGKSRKYLVRFDTGFEGLVDGMMIKAMASQCSMEEALLLPLKHRDFYFAVRADWWNEWKVNKRHAKETETQSATKPDGEDAGGSVAVSTLLASVVDNRSLEDEFVPGAVSAKKEEDSDYVLLHSEVLTLLRGEYGYAFLPEFEARVVKDKFGTLVIELHKIHVQVFADAMQEEASTTLCVSMEARVGEVLQKVATAVDIPKNECSVSYKEPSEQEWTVGGRIPEDERLGDVIDMKVIQMLVRRKVPVSSIPYGGSEIYKRDVDDVVEDDDLDIPSVPSASQYSSSSRNMVSSTGSSSGRYNSYYGGGGGSYYAHMSGTPTARGCVGLRNLGNTCFMNSMLQCLNQIDYLTEFFLSGKYRAEVNEDNVLGMGGKLAHEYANLVGSMWCNDYSTVAPFALKKLLGEVNPAFAGYQQQDSQELMSFLLDQLHEDLNRVKKKPYVEDVEGKGRPDEVVAEEAWGGFLQRNQSIVVDHLFGQLKSHITCTVCKHESVKFDPFSSLPVPLPVKSTHPVEMTYVGINTAHRVKLSFSIEMSLSIMDLKKDLYKRLCEAPEKLGIAAPQSPFHLMVVEIHASKVYQIFEDSRGVVDLRCKSDDIYCYEVQHPVSALSPKNRAKTKAEYVAKYNKKEFVLRPISANHISYSPFGSSGYTYGGTSSYESNNVKDNEKEEIRDENSPPEEVLVVQASQGGKEDTGYNAALVRGSFPHLFTMELDVTTQAVNELLSETFGQYTAAWDEDDTEETSVVLSQNLSDKKTIEDPSEAPQDKDGSDDHDVHVSLDDTTAVGGADLLQGQEKAAVEVEGVVSKNDAAPFVLRLAEYSGKPLTTKRYQYGTSMNPMSNTHNAADDAKFELQNSTEEAFSDFVKNVGKEERWSVNVGWEKDRFCQEYMSKHIALYSNDAEDDVDNINLLKCIETIMEEERLEEGEEWYCSNCKELRQATKKFDLWRTPDILIIHMKRFQYAQGAMFVRRNKLDNLVKFPIHGLDLSKCVKGPSKESHEYDLFAVSEHMGGMGGGHYTAQCKNYRDGEWYDCNDSHVSGAQASDAVTSKAYVLFYKRRGGGVPTDELVLEDDIKDPDADGGDEDSSSKREADGLSKLSLVDNVSSGYNDVD